jgi:hypothetical protein
MELLLNLVWVALALSALYAFLRRRQSSDWTARVPSGKALLAISCGLVLLFPVVSASDDLHPTGAVFEDATKRVHQLVAPLQHAQGTASVGMLPALLALCFLPSLFLLLQWRQPDGGVARAIVRERIPVSGRAPPLTDQVFATSL